MMWINLIFHSKHNELTPNWKPIYNGYLFDAHRNIAEMPFHFLKS